MAMLATVTEPINPDNFRVVFYQLCRARVLQNTRQVVFYPNGCSVTYRVATPEERVTPERGNIIRVVLPDEGEGEELLWGYERSFANALIEAVTGRPPS